MLTRFAGAGLLLLGLYMFLANQKVNSLRSQYMSGPDIIDQDSIQQSGPDIIDQDSIRQTDSDLIDQDSIR